MRPQGSGISQSDTLSARSPSPADNRAVRYKLPSDSVRMALRHLESVEDAAENSTSSCGRQYKTAERPQTKCPQREAVERHIEIVTSSKSGNCEDDDSNYRHGKDYVRNPGGPGQSTVFCLWASWHKQYGESTVSGNGNL